jgi:phenylpyruvate tautomerase PptA (4-oxalocrotonate tautomerase family)
MPLVTITVQRPKTIDFKSKVLSAIHEALVSVGVPSADRFQRVIELDMDDFRFDPLYPDAATPRNSDFVLVEILWSVGRSVKVKKAFLGKAMELLAESGLDPENVMVCFKETGWENWAFAGGRQIHV